MSKPLELTVYPPLKRPRYGNQIDPYREQWKRERKVIEAKRFTDAELAAEYWSAAEEATSRYFRAMDADEAQRLEGAIHRFATLPNYDEATK
jgi:hypothetical protein